MAVTAVSNSDCQIWQPLDFEIRLLRCGGKVVRTLFINNTKEIKSTKFSRIDHTMEFTADNVEKAVSHFYQNLATQSQLNVWLTAAQTSAQAWIFAWQLLDQSKVS